MSLDFWLNAHVDLGGPELETFNVFEVNITHNLGRMAEAAGVYDALWCSAEKSAADIAPELEKGIALMEEDPERFRAFNPPNGWGSYDDFVPVLKSILEACKKAPKAIIGVWK